MISSKWIRANPVIFKEKMLIRGISSTILEAFSQLQEKLLKIDQELNDLRRQKNISEKDNHSEEDNRQLRQHIQKKNAEYAVIHEELEDLAKNMPNILDESVPLGEDEKENIEIRKWNNNWKNQGDKLHHEFLNKHLIEQIHNMSAARFTGLKDHMSILHRAIGNFALDFLREEGFIEHGLPYILNHQGLERSGHLPFFREDLFWLEEEKLALIPTSEVSIGNLIYDTIYNKKDLPLKICCYSPCFRKEAGAAGRDTKGLIRLHQFHKVEMFAVTTQEDSEKIHQHMVSLVEKILQKLDLSYRVLLLCSGDTGFHSSKTYDLEVWMPVRNKYLEISSCSNVKDFQSNRLQSRYRDGEEKYPPHTLNGSCLPIERTLAAIMENYQQTDGTILVPTVLQPYTGFNSFTPNIK